MHEHFSFGPPPPQKEFTDIATALAYCQDYARNLGYGVVIKSTVKCAGKPSWAYLACDRSGKYRDRTKPSAKPRKMRTEEGLMAGTASRKTDCPFQLNLRYDNSDSQWHMIVQEDSHNHPPSLNTAAHPSLRRRDLEKHYTQIQTSYNAGESTRTIISALRAEGAKCLPRDIYNFGQKVRMKTLGGLTSIQWLKEELDRQQYYNKIDVDLATNKVTRLFYIHPTAIQLWKKNPDCLLLDCTYKTNRFNMPLLNICGVTGNNKTPQFALNFLSGEKDEDYKWALTQLCNGPRARTRSYATWAK